MDADLDDFPDDVAGLKRALATARVKAAAAEQRHFDVAAELAVAGHGVRRQGPDRRPLPSSPLSPNSSASMKTCCTISPSTRSGRTASSGSWASTSTAFWRSLTKASTSSRTRSKCTARTPTSFGDQTGLRPSVDSYSD